MSSKWPVRLAVIPLKAAIVLVLAGIALSTSPAHAGRKMIVPAFSWHDWIQVDAAGWCSPAPAKHYVKAIEYTFTNISTTSQDVTLSCTVKGVNWNGAAVLAGATLVAKSFIADPTYTSATEVSIGTLMTKSFTLAPGASSVVLCDTTYQGPAPGGDWHLLGTLESSIAVQQDRGAIIAVANSTMENTCVVFDSNPIGLSVMAMRNTPRTILINGGRPF